MSGRLLIVLLCVSVPGASAAVLQANVSKLFLFTSPLPDSKLVSPETNIIVRAQGTLNPASVIGHDLFSVQGTVSGVHAGRTILSDDESTLLFEPLTPFAAGETVHAALRSGIVTREGRALESIEFSFTVSPLSTFARQMLMPPLSGDRIRTGTSVSPSVRLPLKPLRKSVADTLPAGFPARQVSQSTGIAPGHLFLATFKIAEAGNHLNFISLVPSENQYLMVLDNIGNPMFYRKMPSMSTDFKLQMNGFLTYYDNSTFAYYELDSSYAVIDSFRCGNGYKTDLHDLRVLPDGHQLMLGYDPEMVDMSTVVPGGDPSATVIGAVVQELDRNKHVVFQWRTFDHFKVTDATQEDLTSHTIDYVHPNTIEIDTDGNILLSSRHMDEITKIDRKTGSIIWRWGGKNNQFKYFGDSVGFSHQHTIRRSPTGTLTMLDNGNYRSPAYSRVVEYAMDESAKSVRLVWQYRHKPDLFAIAMGSVERLQNGNTLVGWGTTNPAVTEVRPDGSTAFELRLPDSIASYRVFRAPWNEPTGVAVVREGGGVPVSVSLLPNYPNPFNPSTRIQFGLPRQARVSLKIYDLLGRVVATLLDGTRQAGVYSIVFDGSRLPSGVYLYRLSTPGKELTRTMTLLK
jgi:hypothetical protein